MRKIFPLLLIVALGGCKKFKCRECTLILHDTRSKVYYPASKVSMCGKSKSEVSQFENANNFSSDTLESKAICDK